MSKRKLSYRAAWREVARLWLEPETFATSIGLCRTVRVLHDRRKITAAMRLRMRKRIKAVLVRSCVFAPFGKAREPRALLALLFAEGA